jgi:tRNA A37 threonylcarbamoyladenosine synthetase subunit TsaC/SUA5/YrdC
VVVPTSDEVANRIGSTTATVGVRVPDDPGLCRLLRATGPLAVTSANEHGSPPCHDAESVEAQFGAEPGSPRSSTAVDATARSRASSTSRARGGVSLRVGAVSAEEITSLLGPGASDEGQ